MGNVNLQNSKPSNVLVPTNYPMEPVPGKISILFDANNRNLYHKFNANDYDNGSFGSSQPYIYRYPDDPPGSFRRFGGRGLPLGLGVDDVIRVTKFVASGRGLIFVGKQFVLQGFQPFDETNLYNPTEIILSAASNLTGGILEKPKRHIDKSGGLLGGLAALIGISVSRGSPPPSTVAGGSSGGGVMGFLTGGGGSNRETEVLPVQNYGNGTGLLRGKTAMKARSILQAKWGTPSGGSGGGILGMLKGMAKSMFPQVFGSEKQSGVKQRADELAYDWMINYYNNTTVSALKGSGGLSIGFMGINLFGGNKGNSARQKTSNEDKYKHKYYNKTEGGTRKYNDVFYLGEGKIQRGIVLASGIDFFALNKNNVDENSDSKATNDTSMIGTNIDDLQAQKGKYYDRSKHEDGNIDRAFKKYVKNTEINNATLTRDSDYVKNYEGKSYPVRGYEAQIPSNTKLNSTYPDDSPAALFNESLKAVINNLEFSRVYNVNFDNKNTWLLSSGNTSKQGYDRLYSDIKAGNPKGTTKGNPKNSPNSVESEYRDRNIRTLDSIINPNKNYGLAGNGRQDKINLLDVLDESYTEWKPYEDDLIAFFFYDIVNKKFIPFRSIVNNIAESNNASWEELKFIGRADAVYLYSGFTRNLSFTFNVIVNSLEELYPVWKKINYLASSVKPSNYTKKEQNDNVMNRFIVPPMFMLTIGDLYKYQPIALNTVTINIPQDASWETVPENSIDDWTYLSNIIKSNKVTKDKIGQLPRYIEISIACNLLEKERPIIGGNHFGHSPTDDKGYEMSGEAYLPSIQDFSRNLRVVKAANFTG